MRVRPAEPLDDPEARATLGRGTHHWGMARDTAVGGRIRGEFCVHLLFREQYNAGLIRFTTTVEMLHKFSAFFGTGDKCIVDTPRPH